MMEAWVDDEESKCRAQAGAAFESAPLPKEQKAGLLTGMTVLIATDGSEEILRASRLAVGLIRLEAIERFIVLTVTWPPHDAPLWNQAAM